MPNSEDIYDQVLAKERELVNWFVSLSEEEKLIVKYQHSLHPNSAEEIIAMKFSLKQTKKKIKTQRETLEKIGTEHSDLKNFCSDLLNKYDKSNYSHKVVKTELETVRSELHKKIDALDKARFDMKKVLVTHAVTMFELDRLYMKQHGDSNKYNRLTPYTTPTYQRRTRGKASSGTITSAFI